MFLSRSVKPPSRLNLAARAAQFGVALGVVAFVLTTLLGYQVALLVLSDVAPSSSLLVWLFTRLVLGQMGAVLVAPALAFVAGLLVAGARGCVAAAMILTLQTTTLLLHAVSFGFERLAFASELALLLLGTAAGIALSVWTMGLGQRCARRRTHVAKGPDLSSIDFEAIQARQDEAASRIAETDAAAAPPKNEESPPSSSAS